MVDNGSQDQKESPQVACEEARHTLDQQITKIHQADQKAIEIFRANILLLGVLATGLSITVQWDMIPTPELMNTAAILGSILLGLSTVCAASAYTSSSIRMGVGPRFVSEASAKNKSIESIYDDLQEDYRDWIIKNKNTNDFNSLLITFSIILVVNGIIFLIIGIIIGIQGISYTRSADYLLISGFIICAILDFLMYFSNNIFEAVYANRD